MKRNREIVLLFLFVLGTIKAGYELRRIGVIGHDVLTSLVFLALVVPAWIHAERRRLGIRFFEADAAHVLRSLKLFAVLALAIFPAFLAANHVYQEIFFQARLQPGNLGIGGPAVLTQVLLVAFPEEFFFRGYLQTLLSRRFGKRFRFLGIPVLSMSWSVPLAALTFAAAHSFIALQWWHFAIFFPGLAFGWLRERTNGLVAPTLFHALSNLAVNAIGNVYR